MFNFLTKNLGAKILALVFATFLWVYVVGVSDKLANFPAKIPIIVKNLSSNLAVATELPEVDLKIRAPYASWEKLTADNFTCFVDLAGFRPGEYELDIQAVCSDPAVVVLEKKPFRIKVKIDPLTSKKVPLEAKFEGKPGEGYIVTNSEILPKEVEIRGAKSVLDNILSVYGVIYLDGEMTRIQRKIEVVALDAQGNKIKNLTFEPDSADATVLIQKAADIKTVGIKVNLTGSPNQNYWVSKIIAEPAILILGGKAEALKNTNYIETEKINISGIFSNSTYKAKLIIPEGIRVSGNIKEVEVKVYLSAQESTKAVSASFKYKNGTGSTGDVVKVTLSGPINMLSSAKVSITIDLAGKDPGSYKINIEESMVNIPSGTKVINFSPKTIDIEVY